MGAEGDPGFWHGVLHGVIAPISFVVSLFSDSVRMYAFPNVGRWYDFGFLMELGRGEAVPPSAKLDADEFAK